MFKKIALGLIMALGITLGLAAPAQAVAPVAVISETTATPTMSSVLAPTCTTTYVCLFTGVFWDGTVFQADTWDLPANTCFNFNSFWDNNVNSFWWNEDDPFWAYSYAEIYEGTNCSIRVIARVTAGLTPYDQMRSCNEVAPWDGPCGPPNNVSKRASSWAFALV